MQVTAILYILQLTALAVSAAKLPTPPSTLYGAPLADLPSHSQPAQVTHEFSQPAQVPAELSTLYEAPAADVPSVSQSFLPVQSHGSETFTSVNIPSPVQQSTFAQPPGIEIPVPAVPSTLYDLPSDNLPTPAQHTSFAQTPLVGSHGSVPIPPPTKFGLPADNLPKPSQSPIQVLSPVNLVPVSAEPSTLYDIPLESAQIPSKEAQVSVAFGLPNVHQTSDTHSANLPFDIEQSNFVQTAAPLVPVPPVPSTLYDAPAQILPQTSTLIQTPAVVPQNQFVPVDSVQTPFKTQTSVVSQVQTAVEIPQVPKIPSGLYEVPNEAQSIFNANPSSATFSAVNSVPQPEINVPAKESRVPILFPQQPSFQAPNLVPVPSVPSTLYETPEASSVQAIKTTGKVMPSNNAFQSDFDAASSSLNTFTASQNSLVTSNTKGGMMMGMPYDFQWGVDDAHSGNAFTHYEKSDGKSTSGQYRVNLPDGRVQVVNFYDNGDGFHADVTYE